jgi:competence protein ComEC
MVLIWIYTFLVGGGSSVVRAAVMSSIFLMSFVIEREQDTLNTLAAAALAILIFDPGQLFDVGFQLSFVCVMALVKGAPVLLAPLAACQWHKRPVVWFFVESLAVSIAAGLGSAGMIAYYFGMITPVGLLANIPVVPLSAAVTALGAAIFVAALIPPLAVCFGACINFSLNLMVFAVWLCSLVPGGTWMTRDVPVGAVWGYYVLLVIGYVFLRRLTGRLFDPHSIWNAGL